jgi:hypothetical protein
VNVKKNGSGGAWTGPAKLWGYISDAHTHGSIRSANVKELRPDTEKKNGDGPHTTVNKSTTMVSIYGHHSLFATSVT